MAKVWRFHPHDAERIGQLERSAGISPIVAQLLVARGVFDPAAARTFLDPKLTALRDPEELPGVTAAAERIIAAVGDGRRIVIYGDYDADGVTATALLYRCLTLLGANVGYYVPSRIDEGYGLNDDALRTIAGGGAKLVITVDCGIASVHEAETARELGLELVITDHHAFGPTLPDATALVHPQLPGHDYPFAGLCGAGVAFKLAWALCQHASGAKRVGERMKNFLLQAVGLAAIGTVADVVPLVDENRVLVTHGLVSLKQQPTLGLAALMRVAELHEKPVLSSEDLAFTIGPRLNAAGRLGQAQLAVELLATDSPERAQALAEYLHELNNSRGSLERSIMLSASKQIREFFDPEADAALVLADHDWHCGVIGIVAGRLVEKYHRPVVVVSLDKLGIKPGQGSARSVPGFNLHEALAACSHHLVSHGGHAAAAGLKIEEQNVEAFRADFCEHAARCIKAEGRIAEVAIDAEAPLSSLTLAAVEQLERLAPFGSGNTRPLLATAGVELAQPPKRMGEGGRHVSLLLRQHGATARAVAFGQGDWADELAVVDGPISVAYRPVINHFRGRRSVDLHLVDWKPTHAAVAQVS
ncbi:MAG: single-stranded-DNA-specific exonuclease RecJ [Pirellulales bacterium]